MATPLPTGRVLDELAARKGDRAAEAAALAGVSGLVHAIFLRFVRRRRDLRRHEDDLRQDALQEALGAIRRYVISRGFRLTTFVGSCVALKLRRFAVLYPHEHCIVPPAGSLAPGMAERVARLRGRRPSGDGALEWLPTPHCQQAEVEELDAREALVRRLRALPLRDREVIERRFGLAGRPQQTLAETGAVLGVSRERVRQIEAKALKRLRVDLAAFAGAA